MVSTTLPGFMSSVFWPTFCSVFLFPITRFSYHIISCNAFYRVSLKLDAQSTLYPKVNKEY